MYSMMNCKMEQGEVFKCANYFSMRSWRRREKKKKKKTGIARRGVCVSLIVELCSRQREQAADPLLKKLIKIKIPKTNLLTEQQDEDNYQRGKRKKKEKLKSGPKPFPTTYVGSIPTSWLLQLQTLILHHSLTIVMLPIPTWKQKRTSRGLHISRGIPKKKKTTQMWRKWYIYGMRGMTELITIYCSGTFYSH